MKTKIIWGAALLVLPMLGVWLAGLPLDRYLEFPPRALYVAHAAFSWPAFITLAALELAVVVLVSVRLSVFSRPSVHPSTRPFPRWGWFGLLALAVFWTLAWTRFSWFAPLQAHTFTPLWLSYIIGVNALTFRRAGRCLLTHDTGYLLRLVPISAAFWWFFEYLNRFVQNWSYLGADNFSALEYFLFATLSFSTVLPAVMSTGECLQAHGLFVNETAISTRVQRGLSSWTFLGVACVALLFIGVFPNFLFPLVWLAPLAFFQRLEFSTKEVPSYGSPTAGKPMIGLALRSIGEGGTFLQLAAAAFVCGFFWEMWNSHSLAKWVYHVPYVGDFKIFEMPVLGYFGYLPFGVECGIIAACFSRARGPILRA